MSDIRRQTEDRYETSCRISRNLDNSACPLYFIPVKQFSDLAGKQMIRSGDDTAKKGAKTVGKSAKKAWKQAGRDVKKAAKD